MIISLKLADNAFDAKTVEELNDKIVKTFEELAYKPVVKPTDEQGRFLRNEYGGGKKVVRPGFPEAYARELQKLTGTKYLVPKEEK